MANLIMQSFQIVNELGFRRTQRDRVEREGEGGSGWGTHVNPWLIHVNV